jgi:hypothetical protein
MRGDELIAHENDGFSALKISGLVVIAQELWKIGMVRFEGANTHHRDCDDV